MLLLLAASAAAHSVAPEQIVGGVTAEATRQAWGVDSASRDGRNPRLLVIRVGPRWYERSVTERRTQATAWFDLWHANVPQGIVAIVDAASGTPVVDFGRGGSVTGVADYPRGTMPRPSR